MRLVTLVDLNAGPLPAVTPPTARFARWLVQIYAPSQLPVLSGLTATPVVDGVLLEWAPLSLSGAVYIVGVGESKDGPFTELAQADVTRYLYSNADAAEKWFCVTPSIRGQRGVGATVQAAPKVVATDEDLVELQLKLEAERLARFEGDAKEASDRAAAIADEAHQRQQQIDAERAARQAAVAAAQGRINTILSDSIISADEKPQLIIDYQTLLNELPGIRAEAELSEAMEQFSAYDVALIALGTYLGTLNFPVPWNDTTGFTYIL